MRVRATFTRSGAAWRTARSCVVRRIRHRHVRRRGAARIGRDGPSRGGWFGLIDHLGAVRRRARGSVGGSELPRERADKSKRDAAFAAGLARTSVWDILAPEASKGPP